MKTFTVNITTKYPNVSGTFTNEELMALIECAIKEKFAELEKKIVGNNTPAKAADGFDVQIKPAYHWERWKK